MGFLRKEGSRCREAFWTLNPEFSEPQDAPCVEYWFDRVKSVPGMSVGEAREAFLSFFEKHGHTRVPPRPVVARWREDLYLTIASIVVFQPHVTSGLVPPPANPLVISQPSIRLEDIDNVGITIGRHLTSFEMAAHHAFNYPDKQVYWKEDTVRLAFEFFTQVLGIPPELIVFKESWWEGGGNAGPSFEVAVGGLELATLVFMKYRVVDGRYEEIPLKIVDTGYGVERLAWFTQKTPTAFHAIYGRLVDDFRSMLGVDKPDDSVMWAAFRVAGFLDPEDPESLRSYYHRVASATGLDTDAVKTILTREARLYSVLDHTKTIALMLGDGIVPSNSGEGYLARLVVRRALRQLSLLNAEAPLVDLVERQVKFWMRDFPQLRENLDYILDAVSLEEERFREVLRRARSVVEREIKRKRKLGVDDLVRLYDSMGIPPEIAAEIASSRGVVVEVPHNFYSLVAARHRGPEKVRGYGFEEAKLPRDVVEWASGFGETRRVFHEDPYARSWKARVLGVRGRYLVTDSTIFYPTGGGQIHDTGLVRVNNQQYRIVDVQKVGDAIVHVAERDISAEPGDEVEMEIDWERRYAIMRHHTVTHVLIAAARRVLGRHAWQAGAEKTEEKGRLDITHHKPLTRVDIEKLENVVNQVIRERRRVWEELVDKNVAEERYGFTIYQGGVPMEKKLRLVFVEDWDVEACFGTHVRNTGEIGGFKIVSHSRIQDGVVRLEYVAGDRVAMYARELEERLARIGDAVKASRGQEEARVRGLLASLEEARADLKRYREYWVKMVEEAYASRAKEVQGVKILAVESIERDRRTVQDILRKLTSRHEDLIAALVIEGEGYTQVEMAAGSTAAEKVDLGAVVKSVLERVRGRGGGRGSYASMRVEGRLSAAELEKLLAEAIEKKL
ncbi:alanyl-tRNA synthetase [Aeropyrum camini SY1 = JCM 12091]|uniref:Alanine--tRNA ligase n=2 Tax=Aeropyrum camini TaxID=229980 RepID=U3THL1_9CREN|nr:alanyl-tRNA synthetase [Aeropyrum camini SY1 = JCM 12091]